LLNIGAANFTHIPLLPLIEVRSLQQRDLNPVYFSSSCSTTTCTVLFHHCRPMFRIHGSEYLRQQTAYDQRYPALTGRDWITGDGVCYLLSKTV